MKDLLAKIFNSKKFWYTVAGICVPLITKYFGTDAATSSNIFYAFLTLVGAQGIADIKK
jgi:Mg/Co/Ni transporter MgtE